MPPKSRAPLWGLLLLPLLFGCGTVPEPEKAVFDVQAHRGGRALRPENTLAAFRYAITLGVTTLELDTAVTADGAVVVSHDPRLNSDFTQNDVGYIQRSESPLIKDLNLEQLKTYTVGEAKPGSSYAYKYPDQLPVPGERIPTLDEVFELVRKLGAEKLKFNIEIKTYPPFPQYTVPIDRFVDLVLAVVQKHGMENRVTLQSFDWRTLRLIREQAPEMPIACLIASGLSFEGQSFNLDPGGGPSPWLDGLDADAYSTLTELIHAFGGDILSPHYRQISSEDIQQAHGLGLKVIPWTVNNVNQMRKLIDWGVDGIITDRPDLLKALLVSSQS